MFPTQPDKYFKVDESGKFLVQDPFGLRKSIIPLLTLNTKTDTVAGWGTGFRIDSIGTTITAYHVIEDFLDIDDKYDPPTCKFNDNKGLFGLDGAGLVLGQVGIPNEYLSKIIDGYSICRIAKDKFIEEPVKNFLETALLHMPIRHGKPIEHSLVLQMDYMPKIGERLLAVGFANLDVSMSSNKEKLFTTADQLYGSYGTIMGIREFDDERARPWSAIEVDSNWSMGMSGGPVFNEAGNVIGLVSTGNLHSTAVWFGGSEQYRRLLRTSPFSATA
jgi:serine protease Do